MRILITMKITAITLFLLCGQLFAVELQGEQQKFGTGADMNKLVAISTILTSPDDYVAKDITVKGAIVSVCEKRGCWMTIASDQKFQTLRIKVRDGDMVFPLTAKGKIAYATGVLVGNKLNKENAIAYLKHMAEEANEEFDSASVPDEGITIYQLAPTGVTIAG